MKSQRSLVSVKIGYVNVPLTMPNNGFFNKKKDFKGSGRLNDITQNF